ncbi:MAG: rod shape-determining protein MreC [candidate division WOR-3 bacterium]|nr:rod shape-determining protein MreC [candidate division WOR-3 bacterium]MDH5683851.1 rod shape-determining protein MreC [candidate division WOR-3 bacterium]
MNRNHKHSRWHSDSSLFRNAPSAQWAKRIGEGRLFLVFLLLSIIFLFIPGEIKLGLLKYPRAILLAPLNITLSFFTDIHSLNQENKRLSLLATQLQIENAALKEILQSKSNELKMPELSLQRAQIIGRDHETMLCFLLLDRGEPAGIRVNMPVITESGVVGKVIQTSPLQSLVETMLSRDSKIAALDQRSRVTGIVTAFKTNQLKMNYILPEADIQIGDTIISSGTGGVFTKGLLIGTVTKIDNLAQRLFKDIIIKPFVNIYAIEAVYVITGEKKTEQLKIKTKTKEIQTEWEKILEELKIEPPFEIKLR